ncbi:hypothetical protein GOBAR_DD08579 [Gossypium barbadense]|nr:hypothetical protein GOBAR_DD08579 [Gossypium barbadense]
MASLLQSTTLLFIFSITSILIPNRHAIPFTVLHDAYCNANQERTVQSERVSGLLSVKCAVASTPRVWKIIVNPDKEKENRRFNNLD